MHCVHCWLRKALRKRTIVIKEKNRSTGNLELRWLADALLKLPKVSTLETRQRLRPEDRLMILHFSPHVPLDYVPHFLSREVAVMCQPLAATIVTVSVSPVFVETLTVDVAVGLRQQL